MGKVEDISRHILRILLHDFQARGLSADALQEEYEGVPMQTLKEKCLQLDTAATETDFGIALKDLEDREFIGTGPMDLYSDMSGSVHAMGIYSKGEYAYLKAKGYRAAR